MSASRSTSVFGLNGWKRGRWPLLLLMAVVVAAIYGNGLHAPFAFDDHYSLSDLGFVETKTLSELLALVWSYWARRIGYLTFALNYYLAGQDPFSYRIVNVLIIQRLSSLSALFFLLAFQCYVLGRQRSGLIRWGFFGATAVSAMLAFGVKQNTVMLPLLVFLYAWVSIT
ncbi:MAG: hypothetical protein FJ388_03955 [Verrucomicrobia bacterium]|nr:hypothetical protein [Verrucomicrobiota bacterium]